MKQREHGFKYPKSVTAAIVMTMLHGIALVVLGAGVVVVEGLSRPTSSRFRLDEAMVGTILVGPGACLIAAALLFRRNATSRFAGLVLAVLLYVPLLTYLMTIKGFDPRVVGIMIAAILIGGSWVWLLARCDVAVGPDRPAEWHAFPVLPLDPSSQNQNTTEGSMPTGLSVLAGSSPASSRPLPDRASPRR